MKNVHINYSTDILCVWAYVSQLRIDEVTKNFADCVSLDFSYFPVFGNAHAKIDTQWKEKGGRAAYGKHVQGVVSGFGHLPITPDLWLKDAPTSSLPAHLHLSAVLLLETRGEMEAGASAGLAWSLRHAFFADGIDISRRAHIASVIEQQELALSKVEAVIADGSAYALMSEQTRNAYDNGIKVSPTLTFNEGRQRLSGNVGYRIIEANLRELIESPELKQSWC